MEYKNSLNLPKTDFPMKADLPKRQPLFLERWQKENIYRLILEKSRGKNKYILHDGPPYANGDIHLGHALNKILKDIIVKYKTMRGFSCAYVPGWDCHGLPVEHQLFKELGINKSQIDQVEFRKKAYAYALRFVNLQKEQFKSLGVFGDWDNPYLTLSPDYEEAILNSLAELADKGYIYRGLKPVNWCFECETALAEAEVEYEDHISPSIFVKFKLEANQDFGKEDYLLIWTTTPWTLIANAAVAAHPDFSYYHLKTEKGNLILAKDLLPNVLQQSGIEKYEILKEIKGKGLEGLIYSCPFGSRKGKVVLAEYVSKEEGSGLVHTAPGHGMEDYSTGLKYKLEIIMPVDSKGKFTAQAGEFSGLNVYQANKLILEKLESRGDLLWSGKIQHSYPHCWRCKKPVIFRATKQWFLKIDQDGLRDKLQKAINQDVRWIPEAGKERISAMVGLRPDWCLSRQRYWGVPIPALACENCKEEILDPAVIRKFAEFCAREGSDSWFKKDLKEFLPNSFKCPHCKNEKFSKAADILDVWFDSGASSQAVLKKRKDLEFPASLYLEGSDQHRGWFQSSLITAMCIDAKPPFKNVLTHGFVVDGLGRKMSKSMGNVISPFDIIKDYGSDILRLWVASSDYNEDIRISPLILTRLAESYRKVRNTARFILGNLYDFNPDRDQLDYNRLKRIDKWVLFKLSQAVSRIESAYENFEFYKAYKGIYDFCNEELSMYYLDMVKGRLYTFAAASNQRRASQTVIYEVLNCLVRMMAPIFAFTAEEIWQNMPKEKKDQTIASAHLLDWPEIRFKNKAGAADHLEVANIEKEVIALIPDVAKALEEKRCAGLIGSSFEARINLLTNNQERYTFLASLKEELCEIFKVSQVEIIKKDSGSDRVEPEVLKAEGKKCQRCWNYSLGVGNASSHPQLCENCLKAIGGN